MTQPTDATTPTAPTTPTATTTKSMRAIVQDRYGTADVLRLAEQPVPEIGDDDVLVRVHAAGMDRGTWHLMVGLPYLIRLGYDVRWFDYPMEHQVCLEEVEQIAVFLKEVLPR